LVILVLLILVAVPAGTAPREHDAATIVRKIDELYRSNSSYAEVEMEIVTPHWQMPRNCW